MVSIRVGAFDVHVESDGALETYFDLTLTTTTHKSGVELVHLKLTSKSHQAQPLSQIKIHWNLPIRDIYTIWHSASDRNKTIPPDWTRGITAKVTSQMPACALLNYHGQNRLTFALSDALEAVEVKAGASEETGTMLCALHLFQETSPVREQYEVSVLIDARDLPYYDTLAHVRDWWAAQPGYEPAPVPEHARLPMYSTWYSIHQALSPEIVERQCQLAKELGCESVIVDDGWQTTDNARGYAYCGDWEVAREKFPAMKEHVARVHALNMKYILWYSVPFVGKHSQAWERFKDRMLYVIDRLGAGVLDPRYPEVREYLIQLYEQAVREWDLDGFKLDFVNNFSPAPIRESSENQERAEEPEQADGRDESSIDKAVDRLLTDVMARLRAIKPDILVEFRQSYIGPLMRKYGNMFRAADCPYEFVTNRVRTLDIRLMSGETATHSDMLMWHKDEPPEIVALQLINIIFSVPQISVLLDTVPQSHLDVLRHWLTFWRKNRDVLLDGKLMPLHPEASYSLVIAESATKRLIASYLENVIPVAENVPETLILLNGTLTQRMVLDLAEELGTRRIQVIDCSGVVQQEERRYLRSGLQTLDVPKAGTIIISRM